MSLRLKRSCNCSDASSMQSTKSSLKYHYYNQVTQALFTPSTLLSCCSVAFQKITHTLFSLIIEMNHWNNNKGLCVQESITFLEEISAMCFALCLCAKFFIWFILTNRGGGEWGWCKRLINNEELFNFQLFMDYVLIKKGFVFTTQYWWSCITLSGTRPVWCSLCTVTCLQFLYFCV